MNKRTLDGHTGRAFLKGEALARWTGEPDEGYGFNATAKAGAPTHQLVAVEAPNGTFTVAICKVGTTDWQTYEPVSTETGAALKSDSWKGNFKVGKFTLATYVNLGKDGKRQVKISASVPDRTPKSDERKAREANCPI